MTTPDVHGSHAVGPEKKKGLAWLWILLAVLVLALLAWWLLNDDEEDVEASPTVVAEETEEPMVDETEEPMVDETEEPLDTETPDSEETGDSPATATLGLVLVGEVDLLAEDVDTTTLLGETVNADSVTVQALVADEAFLAGPDPERTVLVRLANFAGGGEPESPMDINEGDVVSFTGTVEAVDDAVLADLQLVDEDALAGSAGDVYVQIDELSMSN